MNNAHHLEIDDHLRFTLTGEKARVVERTGAQVTLRWPSGDRIAYTTSDGIWQHFIKQY